MLRLLGFLYSIGIWCTFGVLVYTHWDRCVGVGGCVTQLAIDFAMGLVWPFFWGGWIH